MKKHYAVFWEDPVFWTMAVPLYLAILFTVAVIGTLAWPFIRIIEKI